MKWVTTSWTHKILQCPRSLGRFFTISYYTKLNSYVCLYLAICYLKIDKISGTYITLLKSYCLSKKSGSNLYSNFTNGGQDFLGIQYSFWVYKKKHDKRDLFRVHLKTVLPCSRVFSTQVY